MSGNKTQSLKLKAKNKGMGFIKLILAVFIFIFSFLLLNYAQDEFTYDSKGRRDPFMPLVTSDGRLIKLETEQGSSSGLALEGIIYDKAGQSYAVVNGSVVKVGDNVGDYQVLKIEKSKVIFIKGGETKEVEIKKEE